ncbi:MAG: hypothetical protein WCF98_10265 [Synechococcus sp. ELA057]|jgi:hypothetical protein
MSGVQFTVDTAELSAMTRAVAGLTGNYNWIVARAMTNSAKAAKAAISDDIFPRIQGGPAGWTRRGLMVSFASPDNLTSNVGFNYGDGSFSSTFAGKGMGTPAGRYMGVNARGGDRQAKSTEVQLRRAGIIAPDQFVTPASGGLKLNAQGNVSGPEYQRILSRVSGFSSAGSTQNTAKGAGSRGRSARKRKQSDYFVMRRDGEAQFIAKRVGKRGFVPALFITDQPNYERRFPVQPIAMAEYRRVFPKEFELALQKELAYQSRKG